MKFFGHIQRMSTERYPKILLGAHTHGTWPKGRPPKRWPDSIKAYCKAKSLEPLQKSEVWHRTESYGATSRPRWQGRVTHPCRRHR